MTHPGEINPFELHSLCSWKCPNSDLFFFFYSSHVTRKITIRKKNFKETFFFSPSLNSDLNGYEPRPEVCEQHATCTQMPQ